VLAKLAAAENMNKRAFFALFVLVSFYGLCAGSY